MALLVVFGRPRDDDDRERARGIWELTPTRRGMETAYPHPIADLAAADLRESYYT
jgi:hypothetical protein